MTAKTNGVKRVTSGHGRKVEVLYVAAEICPHCHELHGVVASKENHARIGLSDSFWYCLQQLPQAVLSEAQPQPAAS